MLNIQEIIKEHKKWFINKSAGKQANFEGDTLCIENFSNAFLQSSNFKDATLMHCIMYGADLKCSDFLRATIKSVDLEGANLVEADFTGAYFESCKFDAENKWINFQQATGSIFKPLKKPIYIKTKYDFYWRGKYIAANTHGICTRVINVANNKTSSCITLPEHCLELSMPKDSIVEIK